ncbi:SdpI family protein [Anaerococcus obesiensis]
MYFFLKNKAYKKISRWSGFRTRLSMKNEKNWKIGNLYASKLSLIFGIISMVMTLFVFYKYDLNDKIVLILVGIQIVFLILISVLSEIKLYFVNKKGTV